MNTDEKYLRTYLNDLETAVGAGEISLEDYERLSGLIATHLPEGHETADASTASTTAHASNQTASLPPFWRPVALGTDAELQGYTQSIDALIDVPFGLSLLALIINLVVWGAVAMSVEDLYFWPVWVAIPVVVFGALKLARRTHF